MADTITFTPIPTAGNLTPTLVTFTPINTFTVIRGGYAREVEIVRIDRTDLVYPRDRGLFEREILVVGTDTFSSFSAADTQLIKMWQMLGAYCNATTAQYGTFEGTCQDNGNPQIMACSSPGFFINYRFKLVYG